MSMAAPRHIRPANPGAATTAAATEITPPATAPVDAKYAERKNNVEKYFETLFSNKEFSYQDTELESVMKKIGIDSDDVKNSINTIFKKIRQQAITSVLNDPENKDLLEKKDSVITVFNAANSLGKLGESAIGDTDKSNITIDMRDDVSLKTLCSNINLSDDILPLYQMMRDISEGLSSLKDSDKKAEVAFLSLQLCRLSTLDYNSIKKELGYCFYSAVRCSSLSNVPGGTLFRGIAIKHREMICHNDQAHYAVIDYKRIGRELERAIEDVKDSEKVVTEHNKQRRLRDLLMGVKTTRFNTSSYILGSEDKRSLDAILADIDALKIQVNVHGVKKEVNLITDPDVETLRATVKKKITGNEDALDFLVGLHNLYKKGSIKKQSFAEMFGDGNIGISQKDFIAACQKTYRNDCYLDAETGCYRRFLTEKYENGSLKLSDFKEAVEVARAKLELNYPLLFTFVNRSSVSISREVDSASEQLDIRIQCEIDAAYAEDMKNRLLGKFNELTIPVYADEKDSTKVMDVKFLGDKKARNVTALFESTVGHEGYVKDALSFLKELYHVFSDNKIDHKNLLEIYNKHKELFQANNPIGSMSTTGNGLATKYSSGNLSPDDFFNAIAEVVSIIKISRHYSELSNDPNLKAHMREAYQADQVNVSVTDFQKIKADLRRAFPVVEFKNDNLYMPYTAIAMKSINIDGTQIKRNIIRLLDRIYAEAQKSAFEQDKHKQKDLKDLYDEVQKISHFISGYSPQSAENKDKEIHYGKLVAIAFISTHLSSIGSSLSAASLNPYELWSYLSSAVIRARELAGGGVLSSDKFYNGIDAVLKSGSVNSPYLDLPSLDLKKWHQERRRDLAYGEALANQLKNSYPPKTGVFLDQLYKPHTLAAMKAIEMKGADTKESLSELLKFVNAQYSKNVEGSDAQKQYHDLRQLINDIGRFMAGYSPQSAESTNKEIHYGKLAAIAFLSEQMSVLANLNAGSSDQPTLLILFTPIATLKDHLISLVNAARHIAGGERRFDKFYNGIDDILHVKAGGMVEGDRELNTKKINITDYQKFWDETRKPNNPVKKEACVLNWQEKGKELVKKLKENYKPRGLVSSGGLFGASVPTPPAATTAAVPPASAATTAAAAVGQKVM